MSSKDKKFPPEYVIQALERFLSPDPGAKIIVKKKYKKVNKIAVDSKLILAILEYTKDPITDEPMWLTWIYGNRRLIKDPVAPMYDMICMMTDKRNGFLNELKNSGLSLPVK